MIKHNLSQFALDLGRGRDRVFEVTREKLIKVSLEAFELLVRHSPGAAIPGTPRDTGYAVNGWYPTLNEKGAGDQRGGDPTSGLSVWAKAAIGDVLWINNGVSYIFALENGHSRQAPQGMVEPAIAFLKNKYSGGVP